MGSYHYQIIKSSWGIAIDIAARFEYGFKEEPIVSRPGYSIYEFTPEDIPIRRVKLTPALKSRLTTEEVGYLEKGMELVAQQISSNSLVLTVEDLQFDENDYQPEGLALAVAGLLQKELDLPGVEVPVSFSKDENRYIFDFDHAMIRTS